MYLLDPSEQLIGLPMRVIRVEAVSHRYSNQETVSATALVILASDTEPITVTLTGKDSAWIDSVISVEERFTERAFTLGGNRPGELWRDVMGGLKLVWLPAPAATPLGKVPFHVNRPAVAQSNE